MSDSGIEIKIGEITYTDETSKFMDTVANRAKEELKKRKPATIVDAMVTKFTVDAMSYMKELNAAVKERSGGKFDNNGEWTGEETPKLADLFVQVISEEEGLMEGMKSRAEVIVKASELIDINNTQQIQMVVMRDEEGGINEEDMFTYVVVYPPEDGQVNTPRQREVSYDKVTCHTIGGIGLMKFGENNNVEVEGKKYVAKKFNLDPISDEELKLVLETHNRTKIDGLIQSIMKVIDKRLKRQGEHIDPYSAMTDPDYAIKYTYACHRGIGDVDHEMIVLPPLEVK